MAQLRQHSTAQRNIAQNSAAQRCKTKREISREHTTTWNNIAELSSCATEQVTNFIAQEQERNNLDPPITA